MSGGTRLYEVLELQPGATQSEIKSSFRMLALKYHPDKAGPSGAARFLEVNNAYKTLSDPKLRAVYDKYGESGLKYADNPLGSMAMSSFGMKSTFVAVSFSAFLVLMLVVIFLSFIAAKVDGRISWPWAHVLSPIFAGDALIFVLLAVLVPQVISSMKSSETIKPEEIRTTIVMLVWIALTFASWCALVVMIAVGLDTEATVVWRLYLIPGYVWSAMIFAAAINGCSPSTIRAYYERVGFAEIPDAFVNVMSLSHTLSSFCLPSFVGVLACRLDGALWTNWFGVASPLFVFLVLSSLSFVLEAWLTNRHMRERKFVIAIVCATFVQIVTVVGLPLASLVMICAKLEGNSIRLAHALIPLYLIFGCVVLFMCCLSCTMCCVPSQVFHPEGDDGEENEERYEADPTEANNGDEGGAAQGENNNNRAEIDTVRDVPMDSPVEGQRKEENEGANTTDEGNQQNGELDAVGPAAPLHSQDVDAID